ncbi:GNAT family N-acetyltransferase [Pedobacter sp. BMA]|uniref:GNAT family N-acetyltransferase n=1 Tax=Pedobacter sp. BMA TaxID=1663685 RepID=UPI00064B7DC6|nr:GNAT family N-acetyltransferase [Pedobacter sp. BMA]KLT66544.1 GNAT family acetyltransferase [Pedobacter sp. BMA]
MKIFTETERLILREILPTDIEGMFELDSDCEVHRYLGNQPISTREQALANIKLIRQQYLDNGIGRWAIIEKNTGNFLGWSGLKFITEQTNRHVNYYDLGYRLIKKYWDQGFATETAIATIDYAFNKLNINEIYAIADCKNEGSDKILKKAGLKFIESFGLNGVEHNWYEIKIQI